MRWNALGQLYAGVGLSGIGPILVRLSPVDPAATAFWRLTLSCVPAAILAWRSPAMPARDIGLALLAGVMLAADLVLWNASIVRTSVLEATLLVMIYPLLVALLPALWLAAPAGRAGGRRRPGRLPRHRRPGRGPRRRRRRPAGQRHGAAGRPVLRRLLPDLGGAVPAAGAPPPSPSGPWSAPRWARCRWRCCRTGSCRRTPPAG